MTMRELQEENELLRRTNESLRLELDNLKKMIFGRRSERHISYDENQLSLYSSNEQEQAITPATTEVTPVVQTKSKAKAKKKKRHLFPANLPRQTQVIKPDNYDEDKMVKIGEDITEILAYTPGKLHVLRTERPRYATKNDPDKGISQAPIAPRLIPQGMVDESLIAHVIEEKILHHTPIYRYAKKLKQSSVDFISQSNLQNWFHTAAEALIPLYDLFKHDLLLSKYLQADETTIIVLANNKPNASHRGYIWVLNDPHHKATIFQYNPTRSNQAGMALVEHYSGILQADGYSAYKHLKVKNKLTLTHCMAHARRKFVEAQSNDPTRTNQFLDMTQQLYQIEKHCRENNYEFDKRQTYRQQQALPITLKMKQWLDDQSNNGGLLPQSPIGKAVAYTLKRWNGLTAYIHDGQLEIDNNLIENTIRPVALGCKNYLFAKNHQTAQNLACLYSIVGTANAHGLCIHNYLSWLLKKVATEKITASAISWLPHKLPPDKLALFKL